MAVVTTPATLERALPAMDNAEVLRIRNDFPVLGQLVNGRPLVYLDSGATSQNPVSVIEAEQEFYEQRNAAVHRGAHFLAVEATEVFEDARQTVADFIGADYSETVWTSNATEGLNLVSYALSNAALWAAQGRGDAGLKDLAVGPGDQIVVTEMEHHANLIPWQELAFRTGATLRYIPIDDAGSLRMDQAARSWESGPRSWPLPTRRTYWAPSTPFRNWWSWAGRPEPWWSWMRASPPRTCPWTSKRWMWISRFSPATRCLHPPESACCTASRRSWTSCRRSSPAAP